MYHSTSLKRIEPNQAYVTSYSKSSLRVVEWVALIRFLFGVQHY